MIITRLSGGMGNQMFQYAVGRSLAIKNNVPLKLDTTFLLHRIEFSNVLRPDFVFRDYDLDVFNVAATIASAGDMKWWQQPIASGKLMLGIDAILRKIPILPGWEKKFAYDPHVLTLGPNAYLAGFWQSPNYFNDIRETLLDDFTLAKPLPDISQALLAEIKETDSVCLHVRRSDIAQKSFHGSMGQDYYDAALSHISSKETIQKVYVFSDDIEWCKGNLHFDFETVFIGPEHTGQKGEGHMALMRACRHFIIPNSTFSWWAAWLATNPDKIVVAPKQWFKNGHIDSKDLIPEEWI